MTQTNRDGSSFEIRTSTCVHTLLEWPTNTFSIDYYSSRARNEPVEQDASKPTAHNEREAARRIPPHTLLIFVPGNPGLMEWYIPVFQAVIERLGPGFAARGASLAGHAVTHDLIVASSSSSGPRNMSIPWSVEGQVLHRAAYLDLLMKEMDKDAKLVFVSHSIGCFFTQQLLVLRPDLLKRTRLVVHKMPFVRMDPPQGPKRIMLEHVAGRPDFYVKVLERLVDLVRLFPIRVVDRFMRKTMDTAEGRRIAVELVRQRAFPQNFLSLGTEEIRNVPQVYDTLAMRLLGKQCPTALLFAGKDVWAPAFHLDDLQALQQKGLVPRNVSFCYNSSLKHDYVSQSWQVPFVVDFIVETIHKSMRDEGLPASRL